MLARRRCLLHVNFIWLSLVPISIYNPMLFILLLENSLKGGGHIWNPLSNTNMQRKVTSSWQEQIVVAAVPGLAQCV